MPPGRGAGGGRPESERWRVRSLVGRLAERDEAAWGDFWRCRSGPMLGLIHHLIRTHNWFLLRGREEDVLGRSFGRLWGGIGSFRGESEAELDAFIRKNTVFACLEELRRLGIAEGQLDDEGPATSDPTPRPQEVWECEHLLQSAIDGLPLELRRVIRLWRLGYQADETAAHLGIPTQGVYDRRHRAFRQLHERLEREEFWDHCEAYLAELRLPL